MQKIRACYEEGLAQDPNLVGKVIVNFLLQNTGKVSRIAVKDSTLHNPMVESCILYEVTKVAFPTFSKGAMEVTYPFLFKVKL